ncbi:peptidoglycan-binding protein, partial [Alkalibacillus haloalkaliphilus]|uniref:peptidoglycan-binding protein n=1 Tax=Alkalibacillus haloalkaliphilus TaxID=94136 RepID=UPI0012FD8E20
FADWDDPNDYFGPQTESALKDFQNYYGLVPHGIADEITLGLAEELYTTPLQSGVRSEEAKEMKEKLVTLGFADWDEPTTLFASETESAVSWFQSHFDLVVNGIGDTVTVNKIDKIIEESMQVGTYSEEAREMKEALNALNYANWSDPNTYFGPQTKQAVMDFQEDFGLPVSGIADYKTLEALYSIDLSEPMVTYSEYDINFSRAVDIQLSHGTPKYDGAGLIDADEANVRYYMNPSNFPEGSSGYLQFLLLDESTNLPASELNSSFLNGAGTLHGTGGAFIEAGEQYGLNELYLIAHALHETSHGTSTLAKGVGVDGSGNVIRENGNVVRDENHPDVEQIVYNMYGYGAFDDDPTNGGAKYAFDRDWFSPEAAVVGGAQQISNNYIGRGQNTLFKMKWDPEYAANNNSLGRQYATHVRWAEIQANMMHSMLGDSINDYVLRYDVPSYNSQPGPDGSVPPPPEDTQDPGDHVEQSYPSGVIGEVQVSNSLNFRKGPSTSYDRIGGISNGTIIDILGDNGGNWLYIDYNGDKGWVSKDYIEILNLYVVDSGNGITIRDNPAGNRVGALPDNEFVVLSLDSNQNIVSEDAVLSGTNYTWYRIYYDGNERWTANNWIEKIE